MPPRKMVAMGSPFPKSRAYWPTCRWRQRRRMSIGSTSPAAIAWRHASRVAVLAARRPSVRAIDSAGQPSIAMGNVLVLVENATPAGKYVFRFQQGRDGYQGCRDVTLRKIDKAKAATGEDGQTGDLECWLYKTASGDLREFNEFYIRFDLAKVGIPVGAKVKQATLTLYGSRQNQVDPAGRQCHYLVAALDEDWQPDMTFARRPGKPAWAAATRPQPSPAIQGSWPYLGGTQQIVPPKEVVIDLTPLKARVESWLRDPASNHGLVVSPGAGRNYNMSATGSTCLIVTLRPRLVIEIEEFPSAASNAAAPADGPSTAPARR